jgi:bifunctional non-homologous end joining protein LigD
MMRQMGDSTPATERLSKTVAHRRPADARRARWADVAASSYASPLTAMSASRELQRQLKRIEPCLPRAAKQPPTGSGWIHEIKHDGYRIDAWRHRPMPRR